MFNLYDFFGRWMTAFGLWSWQQDWSCACEIVKMPGNGGIGEVPAMFVGC
ncbi:hypothetical protein [Burkholderia ubonensis]|nr:hypothetical protein [Burkholderia ubonensis]